MTSSVPGESKIHGINASNNMHAYNWGDREQQMQDQFQLARVD